MIRALLPAACLLAAANVAAPAMAQVRTATLELESAKALWLGRDYRRAYASLLDLRAKPYGRRVEVDFMLATSACQIGHRDYATKVLTNILKRYTLGERAQRGVEGQIRNCAPQNATIVIIQPAVPTTSGGWGKTYYWLDRDQPVASYPARRVREIDRATLTARLVARGSPVPATLFAGEACRPTVGDYVILCNLSDGIDADRARGIVAEADAFVAFLNARYGIRPAEEYVTMRLVTNVVDARQVAERVHGLDISGATIAYSFQEDLSLVAVSAGGSGSVMHELVHLALRRDFGDAPPWLEEGMASLYEVSTRCGAQFVGQDNWRGELLRQDGRWPQDPAIREVIDQEWFAMIADLDSDGEIPLNPSERTERERAVAEGKMRYLAFYLQEQDRLAQVYSELKSAPPDADLAEFQDGVLRSAVPAGYADIERTLASFTARMATERPLLLAAGCRGDGLEIRKDEPQPS